MSGKAMAWLGAAIFVAVLLIAEIVRAIAAWCEFRQMSAPKDFDSQQKESK